MISPKRLLALCMLAATAPVYAQAQDKPIGTWDSYLSYNSAVGIATDGNVLYTVGNQAFYTYKPGSNALPAGYSKVEGMSDIGMRCVGYDVATGTAVLVYSNGNIDLFKDNTFYNIPDLKNKSIAGSKDVAQVYTENGTAYLSSSLGVLVIDLASHNILSTYQFVRNTGSGYETMPVTSFVAAGSYFYATASNGVYRIVKGNPQIADYKAWTKIDSTHGISNMATVHSSVYFRNDTSVYALSGDTLQAVYITKAAAIRHIDGGYNNLFISESSPSAVRFMNTANAITDSFVMSGIPMQVVQRMDSTIWIADSGAGLMKMANSVYPEYYVPVGPLDPYCYDIIAHNKNIWIAHGGFTDNYFALFHHNGIANYSNGTWKYYKEYLFNPFNGLHDFSVMAKDEADGTLYVGSFLEGLYILKPDGTTEVVNQGSIFDGSYAYGSAYNDIVGLAIDNSKTLWVTALYSNYELYARTADGSWYKFAMPSGRNAGPVVVDDYGQIWYVNYNPGGNGGGVVVYNTNGTVADKSDDASYFLVQGAGYGNLPSNAVYSIAKDKNNAIWIGTSDGIGIVNSCSAPFNQTPPCDAVLPIVQYDQYAGFLFKGNNVRTIAVDGGNRKWVGTDDGVWLLSADASKIVYRFTVDNSPLPSNRIRKISIDDVTGDVYIGTDQGMVSFRSTATEGGTSNDNVLIFPNPVKPGYTGTIAIRGLVANADVRITDISGELVYKTKALGGQAVWNGVDYKGHRPQSGVYLVFASNTDGTETYSGKIVFIQ